MIGFFDSGSGGLSVLAALRRRAPHADAVYFGDTLHAPYGERSGDALARLADAGLETLRMFGAQEIVAACNTVSPHVLGGSAHGARIIEMTGPAARSLSAHKGARVLLLATPATVLSGIYERALVGTVYLDSLPIPGLAGAIEWDEPEAVIRGILRRALLSRKGERYDIVILGCTHFPFVREMFEEETGAMFGETRIVDPADAVAEAAVGTFSTYGSGRAYFYISQDSEPFRKRVERMFPYFSTTRVLQ